MAEPAMWDAPLPSKGAVEVVLGPEGELPEGWALPVPVGYTAAVVWVPFVAVYWAVVVAARAAVRAMIENCIVVVVVVVVDGLMGCRD